MAKPFQTINAALAGLARGDTVWLATGRTTRPSTSRRSPAPGTTTFRALPGATPVIDGTSGSAAAGFVVQTAVPDVTFQGLTIQNARRRPGHPVLLRRRRTGDRLHDEEHHGQRRDLLLLEPGHGRRARRCQGNVGGRKTTGTVVENNEVYGATAEGIGLYDGSTDCTVAHNVIHDNYSVNLYLDSISHSTFDGNLIYETERPATISRGSRSPTRGTTPICRRR